MIETLQADYIRTARAKGMQRHPRWSTATACAAAITPIATIFGGRPGDPVDRERSSPRRCSEVPPTALRCADTCARSTSTTFQVLMAGHAGRLGGILDPDGG